MKNFLFTAALVVIAAMGKAQPGSITNEDPNAPVITFETETIDYGSVQYDSDGWREFKFKNTGKEPLLIQSVTKTCGCTTPEPPKDPIKPGETGVIKVHYDTKRQGQFEKVLTVNSNAKTAVMTIKIKGTVLPPK